MGNNPGKHGSAVHSCQIDQNQLAAIEAGIENLMEAFGAEEIPYPRTAPNIAKFNAYMGQLKEQCASLAKTVWKLLWSIWDNVRSRTLGDFSYERASKQSYTPAIRLHFLTEMRENR
jgi:hypothetical protein